MDGHGAAFPPTLSLRPSLLFTDAYMWPSFANGAGGLQDGGGVKEEESEEKRKGGSNTFFTVKPKTIYNPI